MDPKIQQALLQALGRVVEIIESASGAGGPEEEEYDEYEGAPPDDYPDDYSDEDDEDDYPGVGGMGPDYEDDEEAMDGAEYDEEYGEPMPQGSADDGTDTGGSLDSRVRRLEQHVGLRKALSGLPFYERLDALERHFLGEEYAGDTELRVWQLEKAASQGAAPEVIPLDQLIKAAVKEGAREVLRETSLPDLPRARQQTRRRALPTSAVGIEELTKSAQDGTFGFAEALLYQWHVKQGGQPMGWEEGDED